MDSRSFMVKAFRVLTALAFICCCTALPSLAAPTASSVLTTPLFSDFDGDHKVDHAELFSQGSQTQIRVTFGTFRSKSLSFDSELQDHGQLMSDDIDSDGDTDLVWVSQSQPRKIVMWLGDGHGNFSMATGTDRTQLEELLGRAASPQVTHDSDACESTCLLESAAAPDVEVVSATAPPLYVSRSPITVCAGRAWTAFLSVLRKRGPPALVS
jgi:hypothetical protein